MTFDLTPHQARQQARARAIAHEMSGPLATEIDATAAVPAPVLAAIDALDIAGSDPLTSAVMIEEIATVSASAAAIAGLGGKGAPAGFAGLRGVPRVEAPTERHQLAMAAVCLGIGRAALAEALDAARARGDRPAGEPGDPPHWALADAATEVDAARLLVHAAASGRGMSAAAVLVYAAGTATRAVDAALRIVGPDGYRAGSRLDRCARDARAACLVLGTEDQARRVAADALLSQASH